MIKPCWRVWLTSSRAAWIFFAFYNTFLLYFSLVPGEAIEPFLGTWNDKLLHAGGYFALCLLSFYAFARSKVSVLRDRALFWALWWSINMGAITEYLQSFVPGRFMDPYDLLANGAGALLGAALVRLSGVHKKRPLFDKEEGRVGEERQL